MPQMGSLAIGVPVEILFTCNLLVLATAAISLSLRFCTGGRGQKLLPTVFAAKVDRLAIAYHLESSCFVYSHAADGIFGHGFRLFHRHVSFLVVFVIVFLFRFSRCFV